MVVCYSGGGYGQQMNPYSNHGGGRGGYGGPPQQQNRYNQRPQYGQAAPQHRHIQQYHTSGGNRDHRVNIHEGVPQRFKPLPLAIIDLYNDLCKFGSKCIFQTEIMV